MLLPWRWTLGDRPFIDEENLGQISSLPMYPFAKFFALMRGSDVTGFVLYNRLLCLLMVIAVAVVVFIVIRHVIRWEFALLIATLPVSFLFWEGPQLTYVTMATSALTVAAVCGVRSLLLGGDRRWSAATGVAVGLAVVAHPVLLFVAPFFAIFLLFALGQHSVCLLATGRSIECPEEDVLASGKAAWRVLSSWSLGAAAVLLPIVGVILWLGGRNLSFCWSFTRATAHEQGQLAGGAKGLGLLRDALDFLISQPFLLVAALAIYLLFRRAPRAGRALLSPLALALFLAGLNQELGSGAFVIAAALATPYLFLFLPQERKEMGARLLLWVWGPAVLAGAIIAYLSSDGYEKFAVGLFPSLLITALFLAWMLETLRGWRPRSWRTTTSAAQPWLALVALSGIVVAALAVQLNSSPQRTANGEPMVRITSGPWRGIFTSAATKGFLAQYEADIHAQYAAGEQLLVIYRNPGLYLPWRGKIAANSASLWSQRQIDPLSPSTVRFFARRSRTPSVVVHLLATSDLTPVQLQAASGGLEYEPVRLRPSYLISRKPTADTAPTAPLRHRRF